MGVNAYRSRRRVEAEEGFDHFAAARADDAGDADDLARTNADREPTQEGDPVALERQIVDLEHRPRIASQRRRREGLRRLAPHDLACELVLETAGPAVLVVKGTFVHDATPTHDRDAVGEANDLVEPMRHDGDRGPLCSQTPQGRVELVGLERRENGRWLVEQDRLRAAIQNAQDLEALPLAYRQRIGDAAERNPKARAVHQRADVTFGLLKIEATKALGRLGSQHHVLEHGERANEHEVLMYHPDAATDGFRLN